MNTPKFKIKSQILYENGKEVKITLFSTIIWTRYGYIEDKLNNEDRDRILDTLSLPDLFLDILKVLRTELDPEKCLIDYCSNEASSFAQG